VREYRVLINYERNGVSIAQSLYAGPQKKHADHAFAQACVLGRHGILTNCTVKFFDGFRLREDLAYGFHTFPSVR
jgi:hypothetical protein